MNPIDARNLINAANRGDRAAAQMLSEMNQFGLSGKWADKRAAKKAGRVAKRADRKSSKQIQQEGLRRKTYRQEARTFGSFGATGSMAGFHAKNLAKDVARDAQYGLDPQSTDIMTRGQEDVFLPEVVLPAELEMVEEQTWIQKNWPMLAIGGVVVIGGAILMSKKS